MTRGEQKNLTEAQNDDLLGELVMMLSMLPEQDREIVARELSEIAERGVVVVGGGVIGNRIGSGTA